MQITAPSRKLRNGPTVVWTILVAGLSLSGCFSSNREPPGSSQPPTAGAPTPNHFAQTFDLVLTHVPGPAQLGDQNAVIAQANGNLMVLRGDLWLNWTANTSTSDSVRLVIQASKNVTQIERRVTSPAHLNWTALPHAAGDIDGAAKVYFIVYPPDAGATIWKQGMKMQLAFDYVLPAAAFRVYKSSQN